VLNLISQVIKLLVLVNFREKLSYVGDDSVALPPLISFKTAPAISIGFKRRVLYDKRVVGFPDQAFVNAVVFYWRKDGSCVLAPGRKFLES